MRQTGDTSPFPSDQSFAQAAAALPDWDIQKIVADKSKWYPDVTNGILPVLRIQISNMTAEQVLRLNDFLTTNGVKAEGHTSKSLGAVLRLKGEDVFTFQTLQEKTAKNLESMGPIGTADWKRVIDRSGRPALYADWDSMSIGDRMQTQFRLTSYNIPFEVRQSSTNGKVLAVTAENPMELRLKAAQPQPAAKTTTPAAAL
jgi:hypothetical protein